MAIEVEKVEGEISELLLVSAQAQRFGQPVDMGDDTVISRSSIMVGSPAAASARNGAAISSARELRR